MATEAEESGGRTARVAVVGIEAAVAEGFLEAVPDFIVMDYFFAIYPLYPFNCLVFVAFVLVLCLHFPLW